LFLERAEVVKKGFSYGAEVGHVPKSLDQGCWIAGPDRKTIHLQFWRSIAAGEQGR